MKRKIENKSKPVSCMDCKHSVLMQWGDNPIISECHMHKDGWKFEWEHYVAARPGKCNDYEKDFKNKVIHKVL